MVPTRRLWTLLLLGVPLGAVFAYIGSPWLLAAYDGVLLLAAYGTWRLAPSFRGLRVQRRFDPVLSVRVANRIELVVSNDGAERIVCRLRDEPPPPFHAQSREFSLRLEPGKEKRLAYWVTPGARGSDYFRGTFVRIRCPLGLVERQTRLPTEQPVRVYPNVLALREFDLLRQKGMLRQMGIRRSRMRGLGTEFESLREYSEGDDYRKIDWKATARRGKLVVRQFEQERNQAVMLCVDVGRNMLSEAEGVTKLDHALDACLMLANAAAASGDRIGLLVYGDFVRRYIPPGKGRSQVGAVIEALHDLAAEPVASDPVSAFAYFESRWKRRSLVVVFTDAEDEEEAGKLRAALGALPRRHLALIARVADPKLEEVAYAPIDSPESMYGKAASLLFLTDRRKAGSALGAAGLHSLEAEPQDLAAALVSYYFQAKERSLV